jgi:aminoglycoside 3-N-acetyltransferase
MSPDAPDDPQARLAEDLAALGLRPGTDLLVHCSMRRVGGSPATLVAAIRDVVGVDATLVVPTHTAGNSTTTPSYRAAAGRLPPAQVAAMEALLPPFHPAAASHGMGALAEYVRQHPGAVRSDHPQTSFAALGPRARHFTAVHDLDCHLGERSPLARLYAAGATILLLGVGYSACTALHLAEYRLPSPPPRRWYRCYVRAGGRPVRADFLAPALDDSDFERLGADLDRERFARAGRVGNAASRAISLPGAVDFAVGWLAARRPQSAS